MRFDVAAEMHLIRALGLVEGWPVDLRGPVAGPSGIHLGPLSYLPWVVGLVGGGGVFGVLVLKGILGAAAAWFAGLIVLRRPGQGPRTGLWAGLTALAMMASHGWELAALGLTHATLMPLPFGLGLYALHRFLERDSGGGWLVVATACAAVLPQLHVVGVAMAPLVVGAWAARRRQVPIRVLVAAFGAGLLCAVPLFLGLAIGSSPSGVVSALGGPAPPLLDTLTTAAGLLTCAWPGYAGTAVGWVLFAAFLAGNVNVVRCALARRAAPLELLLLGLLAVGLAIWLVLGRYALKPQYLVPLAWAWFPLGGLGLARLALPERASPMPGKLLPPALALLLAAEALTPWGHPPTADGPDTAWALPLPGALTLEELGKAVHAAGLGPTSAERRLHGLARNRLGGLRYAMLRHPEPESQGAEHVALCPAAIPCSPLALESVRFGEVDAAAERWQLAVYRPAIDYGRLRTGPCVGALPFARMEPAPAELAAVLRGAPRGQLCPNGWDPSGTLDMVVPLSAGPAGTLNVVMDSPTRMAPRVTPDPANVVTAIVTQRRVPVRWELYWFTLELPARRTPVTLALRLDGIDRLALLDVF